MKGKNRDYRRLETEGRSGRGELEGRRRLQAQDEGLKKVGMEDREEGPEGGCNLAGGSKIRLRCRATGTNTQPTPPPSPPMTAEPERWSVGGEYCEATGTNTKCPREVSDNTVFSKCCMVAV